MLQIKAFVSLSPQSTTLWAIGGFFCPYAMIIFKKDTFVLKIKSLILYVREYYYFFYKFCIDELTPKDRWTKILIFYNILSIKQLDSLINLQALVSSPITIQANNLFFIFA